MIEKYLTDSIGGKERKDKVVAISKMNLIPPRLVKAMRTQDSLMHSRDSAYLMSKGYIRIIKDTIGLAEDEDDAEALDKLKKDRSKKELPPKDSTVVKTEAILRAEKKRAAIKDSLIN